MYLGCIFLLISLRILLLSLDHLVDVGEDLEGEHGALHLLLALEHVQHLLIGLAPPQQ